MKKVIKVFAVVLTVALFVSMTLTIGVISVSAESTVVVWEGSIDTTYYLYDGEEKLVYNSSLARAIQEDIATYGPVASYTLITNNSYCFDGGFVADGKWGFYQSDPPVLCWSDEGSTFNQATWTNTYYLSDLGSQTYLCLTSRGDSAYVGTIRLVATHTNEENPSSPEPIIMSGETGDCTWTLRDKELTISGFGAMADYDEVAAPWGTEVEQVNIEAGVTKIGYRAFFACKSLSAINVAANNNTYTSIDGVVFNKAQTKLIYCPEGKVGSYGILNGVTEIEESAFLGCEKLTGVSIPSSVKRIGYNAFFGTALCNDVANYDISGALYVDSWLIATLPDRLSISYRVKEGTIGIAGGAFYDCTSLRDVEIPSSVKSIGDRAFQNCRSLVRVDIPIGVKDIGNYVFYDCTSLATLTLPRDVERIGYGVLFRTPIYNDSSKWDNGILYINSWVMAVETAQLPPSCAIREITTGIADGAFVGCTYLVNVSIPESVVYIGEGAFYECSKLGSVVIPSKVTSINESTFYNCKRLASATIPSGVTTIKDEAFYGCESLTGIVLPSDLKTIGEYAFCGCNLDTVMIPNGVEMIGKAAFYFCPSLKSISISDSVMSIGEGAFSGTAFYKDVSNWKYGVLYIGSWLIDTKPDELPPVYTFEEGTKKMANGAFFGCTRLEIITISSGVTNISDRAFSACAGLRNVTIPLSVSDIGDCAFYGCSGLETVTFEGTPDGWELISIQNGNDELLKPRFEFQNIVGDANDDGMINMKDVLVMRKYLADMFVDINLKKSDINADGSVNMKDVLVIRKYLAGIIVKLG